MPVHEQRCGACIAGREPRRDEVELFQGATSGAQQRQHITRAGFCKRNLQLMHMSGDAPLEFNASCRASTGLLITIILSAQLPHRCRHAGQLFLSMRLIITKFVAAERTWWPVVSPITQRFCPKIVGGRPWRSAKFRKRPERGQNTPPLTGRRGCGYLSDSWPCDVDYEQC